MVIVKNVASKFDKGVSAAKGLGGKFDGVSKVWRLNDQLVSAASFGKTGAELVEWLGFRGLRLVETAAPAAPVRHDASCPALLGGVCECK